MAELEDRVVRGLFCGLELPQYLFCETTKTVRGREQNLVILCNTADKHVGKLYLHNAESLALFPKLGEKELLVDVVVVYKSSTYSKAKTRARKKYDHPVTKQDACVVL
jgi:hypothetical protein